MRIRLTVLLTLMAFAGVCRAVDIIPYPQSVEMTEVVFDKANLENIKYKKDKKLASEAYELQLNKKGIVIRYSTDAGRFYAEQSLKQLADDPVMYCGVIKDEPSLPWRGLMLDESRHFFGKQEVFRILDLMGRYKLNRFHWHLSDDQGWRVEIKAYPNLTTVGGVGCNTDANAPAKFYTQDEIREIVAYAAERHIEVIPEIDMPGHASAFVKVFPEFNGTHRTVNPANEKLYEVLATIYGELAELFPGRYLHIGGDEVHKGGWNNLPGMKELMAKGNLKSMNEVEEYFGRRLSDIITATGKNVVAWDDLIDSGTNPEGKVMMWWRSDQPQLLTKGIEAGFDMIVCPDGPFYLDYVQDIRDKVGHLVHIQWVNEMKEIYEYDLLDNPKVVGVQSNIWTEKVVTTQRLEYMIFPRLIALAEKGWTKPENLNYDCFTKRLANEYKYLDTYSLYYYDFRKGMRRVEPTK